MAVDYSLYHHNHIPHPSASMLSPMDILLETQTTRTHFKDMHVWGCPCYVLDPAFQDGQSFQMETLFLPRNICQFVPLSFFTCSSPSELWNWQNTSLVSCHVRQLAYKCCLDLW